jgi:hypothetical protein
VNRYLVVAHLSRPTDPLVVPWSGFWERNYFTQGAPVVEGLLWSPAACGAISGLGVVNLVAGIADLFSLVIPRRR